MQDDNFAAAQQELVENFEAQGRHEETADDVAFALLEFIFERERLRHQMEPDDPNLLPLFRDTLAKLAAPDALGPEFSVAEAFLRRLAVNPPKAMEYMQKHVAQRSAAQSVRASKPRANRHDSVTSAIRLIVEEDPNVSAKAVERELATMDGFLFIEGEIRVGDEAPVKVKNLPSRVSDARKSVTKNRAN
jgi:hypothetical protein